ncbi:MAG: carbamoyltransferase HypF, partial [Planctomycetes bacterium]|nr:carbamoyltransferase HypF [Planctomycetota bacterium]
MERRAIAVRGVVQGVGFRPFVYGLASHLELGGFVKNWTGGVLIEVEGDASSLDCFLAELARHPPPLARVEQLSWQPQPPRGEGLFRIETSEADPAGAVFISPDVATCADCLAELGDPADPRYLYPFLNCTNCGPRLTIVRGAPYDRERTTMASFPMCARCRREYEDPSNRRFHAQPTACPDCGPQLGA